MVVVAEIEDYLNIREEIRAGVNRREKSFEGKKRIWDALYIIREWVPADVGSSN